MRTVIAVTPQGYLTVLAVHNRVQVLGIWEANMIGVKIQYMTTEAWDALDWDEVAKLIPDVPAEKPDSYYYLSPANKIYWVGYEEATLLANLGLKLEIQSPNGMMITKMRDKWQSDQESIKQLEQGAAVQIAIPGFGLLAVSKVTHLDDACTDQLQGMLDQGWKILAVCPPNSQRRPDYILGK